MKTKVQESGVVRRKQNPTDWAVRKCNNCGETIPSARIQAIPTATTCVQCQTEIEVAQNGGSILSRP